MDEVFDVLSSARRRRLLHALQERGGTARLQDLAVDIAAQEEDTSPEEVGKQEQNRVYISLYQTHVPKLESVGLVEYDSDTQTLRLTDGAAELRSIDADAAPPQPWHVYSLVLGVVGLLLAVVGVVGVARSVVFPLALVGVSAGALVLAGGQYRDWRARRRAFESFEGLVD